MIITSVGKPNAKISEWVAARFPKGYKGFAADVGASDGISVNSTAVLEKQMGWTVMSVEANPFFYKRLIKNRAFVACCAVGSASATDVDFFVNTDNPEAYSALVKHSKASDGTDLEQFMHKLKVNVRTLDEVIAEADFPRLDALLIDVEGTELDVLKGASLDRWRPSVIILEAWTHGANDEYLSEYGYRRVPHEEWFADNDFYEYVG